MESLKIGTMNVRNRYNDLFYDGKENAKALSTFLRRNDVDILGTQELIPRYIDHLKKECDDTYEIVGKARWCNGPLSRISINFCNETNSIISRHKVQRENTYYLARIPLYHTQMPRIVTMADIKVGEEVLTFINTHIEYWDRCRLLQLKRLLHILENLNSQKVLMTGDFNMDNDNPTFKDFVSALEEKGIHRIPMNAPTYIKGDRKETLDHIFYGDAFTYEDVETFNMGEFSDHSTVLAKVKLK